VVVVTLDIPAIVVPVHAGDGRAGHARRRNVRADAGRGHVGIGRSNTMGPGAKVLSVVTFVSVGVE